MTKKNPLTELANGEWQLVQSSGDWLFIIDGDGNIIADIADQIEDINRERIGRLMASSEKLRDAAQILCDKYSDYITIHYGPAADVVDDALYDEYEALALVLQSINTSMIARCHTRNYG